MPFVSSGPRSGADPDSGIDPADPRMGFDDRAPGRAKHRSAARCGEESVADDRAGGAATASERSDPEAVARILCLRQLDARARTRAELAAYLSRKGVPGDSAERVLDRFVQVGLIDDRGLADSFVDSRHRGAGLGRRALVAKLRQRGVEDAVIDAAVSPVDAAAELNAARELARRKLRSVARFDRQVQARRLVAMLARKGYAPALAYQVVRETLVHVDQDDD